MSLERLRKDSTASSSSSESEEDEDDDEDADEGADNETIFVSGAGGGNKTQKGKPRWKKNNFSRRYRLSKKIFTDFSEKFKISLRNFSGF